MDSLSFCLQGCGKSTLSPSQLYCSSLCFFNAQKLSQHILSITLSTPQNDSISYYNDLFSKKQNSKKFKKKKKPSSFTSSDSDNESSFTNPSPNSNQWAGL
ncbi:hypothetical protein HDU92_001228 [Lobulomyces angularis]|nr:hypothetical protein HDU92_001228 [Lobulomyces angularis]